MQARFQAKSLMNEHDQCDPANSGWRDAFPMNAIAENLGWAKL